MAYPYYYYPYPLVPPMLPDPFALMYMLPYTWIYYISTVYYMKFYELMLETWRRYLELLAKEITPPGREG